LAETLAELLRGFRTNAGLTQAALAEKAGLSEQAISTLERGSRRRPRVDTLEALIAALGLSAESAERLTLAARGASKNPQPTNPPTLVVPRQLPPTLADFTGRDQELTAVVRVLVPDGDRASGVNLAAVTGMGGVGKTSLAVHAAHLTADSYPDGHLYLDLRGYGPGDPIQPIDALGQLLRSLGVDGSSIPEGVDEAASLYRSTLAGRRVLVVLDNANGAAQVRPLLPGAPGSAVIVTSRRGLNALPGFTHLTVSPLSAGHSVELLAKIAGGARIAAESTAAHSIVELSGHLPLAVRLIGARLAARPSWPLEHIVDQLRDERRRLDEFGPGDSGVRANIAASVEFLAHSDQRLDRQAAAALDLLGLPNGSDMITLTTSRLLDLPEQETERMLERLVDLNLLESVAPGRYRLHDLIRAYARERADAMLSEGTRLDALARVLHLYTGIAWRCHSLTHRESHRLALAGDSIRTAPQFADTVSVTGWLDRERANLTEAFQQARRSPVLRPLVPELAVALFGYQESRGRFAEMRAFCTTGRQIAGELGLARLAAWLEHDLAVPDAERGEMKAALSHLRKALVRFREVGDLAGQARCCSSLSHILERLGQLEEAVRRGEEALELSQEIGDHTLEGISYLALGTLYCRQGDYVRAGRAFTRAIALAHASGNNRSLAKRYQNAGESYQAAEHSQEAVEYLEKGVEVYARISDVNGQSECHRNLADLHRATGDLDAAAHHAETGLRLAQEVGNHDLEGQHRIGLGRIAHARGDLATARAQWQNAAELLTSVSAREASTALGLLRGLDPASSPSAT
jgi:tetratricopeptide (TPR) repeat protein/transcriptional regulator with XRE-family HTH domain